MTNNLAAVRTRIHQKSENYFTLSYNQRDPKHWRMFYGATDALLDASMAATAYDKSIQADPAINLLVCYGFLQAIYIQQDAVWTLSRSIGLDWHPNDDPKIKEIRDLRNRLTGHPALAGEKGKSQRPSSAIIVYHEVRQDGFNGQIYYEKESEYVNVHAPTVLRDNEDRLTVQMRAIETEMDRRENLFRAEQATKPFVAHFGTGFDYLVQRLRPEMDNEGRAIQATTHASMIRERVIAVRDDLNCRNLSSEATSYLIAVVLDGLSLLEEMIEKGESSSKSQNQIDVIHDGLSGNIYKLKDLIDALDKKIKSPI